MEQRLVFLFSGMPKTPPFYYTALRLKLPEIEKKTSLWSIVRGTLPIFVKINTMNKERNRMETVFELTNKRDGLFGEAKPTPKTEVL